MKNTKIIMTLFMVLVLMLASCVGIAQAYQPGTYTGEANGFGGVVKVSLTVSDSAVTEAILEGAQETPGLGAEALPTLAAQILAAQSEAIDGVTGATVTSAAAKTAAAKAFAQARGETYVFVPDEVPANIVLAENEYFGMDPYGACGIISLKVKLDGDDITNIKVIEQHETRGLGTTAILQITKAVVETDSVEVDSVTGATLSSSAVKRAILRALETAKNK